MFLSLENTIIRLVNVPFSKQNSQFCAMWSAAVTYSHIKENRAFYIISPHQGTILGVRSFFFPKRHLRPCTGYFPTLEICQNRLFVGIPHLYVLQSCSVMASPCREPISTCCAVWSIGYSVFRGIVSCPVRRNPPVTRLTVAEIQQSFRVLLKPDKPLVWRSKYCRFKGLGWFNCGDFWGCVSRGSLILSTPFPLRLSFVAVSFLLGFSLV